MTEKFQQKTWNHYFGGNKEWEDSWERIFRKNAEEEAEVDAPKSGTTQEVTEE